jgi:hypothetical protein
VDLAPNMGELLGSSWVGMPLKMDLDDVDSNRGEDDAPRSACHLRRLQTALS